MEKNVDIEKKIYIYVQITWWKKNIYIAEKKRSWKLIEIVVKMKIEILGNSIDSGKYWDIGKKNIYRCWKKNWKKCNGKTIYK